MLIQTSSPRPILNTTEAPKHIKVHTIRKIGVSNGEVFFNVPKNLEGGRVTGALEPYEVFPIEGEDGFEGMEFYLPFDTLYGTTSRLDYDEDRIMTSLSTPKRIDVSKKQGRGEPLRDTQFALLGASGFHVIAKTAYRSESSRYEERIFNFSVIFPVTGGGIIRVANSPVDVTNSTFNPRATIPRKNYPNLELLNAFNRTHKPIPSKVEDLRRQRIAAAEASMSQQNLLEGSRKALPPKSED